MTLLLMPADGTMVCQACGARKPVITSHHRIFGVAQDQSGDGTLSFKSQDGLVRVADLPRVAV
jgi:hypothetical protein